MLVDVHGLVVWFSVWVVLSIGQVERGVEKVCNFCVGFCRDVKADAFECFVNVFPGTVCCRTSGIFQGYKAIIPI